jgi:hypothetical protein
MAQTDATFRLKKKKKPPLNLMAHSSSRDARWRTPKNKNKKKIGEGATRRRESPRSTAPPRWRSPRPKARGPPGTGASGEGDRRPYPNSHDSRPAARVSVSMGGWAGGRHAGPTAKSARCTCNLLLWHFCVLWFLSSTCRCLMPVPTLFS